MAIDQPFRAANGNRYTRQLFYEEWVTLPEELRARDPLYSLMHARELHGKRLPCFRELYVQFADPSGYELATTYLESYLHWEQLLDCTWFAKAKESWDRELDAKLAAEGLRVIRTYAEGVEGVSPAVQLTAARYLSDKAYRPKTGTSPKRGRPSKAEIEANLNSETQTARQIADDLARIRKGAL